MKNSGEEGGLAILEFGGQRGDEHFGISEGKEGGGVKMLMPTVVGYGYFLESPYVNVEMLRLLCYFADLILM